MKKIKFFYYDDFDDDNYYDDEDNNVILINLIVLLLHLLLGILMFTLIMASHTVFSLGVVPLNKCIFSHFKG